MMTPTFESRVTMAYMLLCAYVALSPDKLLNPNFAGILQAEDYGTDITTDPTLVRWAIISEHPEWETLYQTRVEFTDVVLGDFCRDVREEGLRHLDMTWEEMHVLRENVLYKKLPAKS